MARNVDKPSPGTRLPWLLMIGWGSAAAAQADTGPAAVMAPTAIARAAETQVRASLGDRQEAADDDRPTLIVRAQPPDPRLRLANCTGVLHTQVEGDRVAQGRALVRVACRRPIWSVFVPVSVDTEADVLVASRPLARGTTPSRADVRLERRRFSGVSESYVKSIDELSRYRLRRPLVPGALLARDALEPAPVVRRGSMVTLRAESGGFRIDAQGRAMADAAPGERIRVQNATSLTIVEGIADELGIVRLDR